MQKTMCCWLYTHAGYHGCAVGFTVMQEIKTVLSQAACLHPVKQIQKKCYYQSEDGVLKVQLILVFVSGKIKITPAE